MALFRGKGARRDGTVLAPGIGTTPIEVRKAESAYWASTGVVPGGPTVLVSGTAGWAYLVAGPVHFVTSRSASDGHQLYGNDGAVTIGTTGVGSTVPVAPGTGLTRVDILWTRHPTNLENSDTSSAPLFGVASGTPGAPGLPPSIPVGAIEIGRNVMSSSATSTASAGNTITQTTGVAAMRGPSVLPRDGATGAPMPGGLRPLIQAFPVIATTSGAGLLVVTFPVPFAAVPVVTAMTVNFLGANPVIPSGAVSATGVSLYWPASPSAAVHVGVIAIGWV